MQPDEILFQRRGADPEAHDELIVRKLPLANMLRQEAALATHHTVEELTPAPPAVVVVAGIMQQKGRPALRDTGLRP